MTRKELIFFCIFLFAAIGLFFYKTIFFHQIPFPGDLLVSTTPFKAESYLGYPPGGYPNKAQGRDVITQSYPWKVFSIHQLKKGQLPLWNPYNFSGNAHIANYQTGIFYPFNLVFFIFSFPVAWSLFIILQPILAIIFMYLFLRDLSLKPLPSAIGSLAFGFSSYMTVWIEYGNIGHTLLWLPLLLFSVNKYLKTQKNVFVYLLILGGVMCLLAGYIQGAFYVFLMSFLYAISKTIFQKKSKKMIFLFSLFFLTMIGFAAIQIFPTLFNFAQSTRGSYTQDQIHNLLQPWYYLVTVFSSEFFGNPATRNFYLPITYFERVMYVGIPLLFFAFYALEKIRSFEIKFFTIFAGVVLLLTTDLPGISLFYTLQIPVISTTVPTRFLSIFIFSIIILGSFGIDYWMKKKEIKSFVPILFAAIYILLWITVMILPKIYPGFSSNAAITKHTLLISTALAIGTIVVFLIRKKSAIFSYSLLALLVIIDLFYVFTKFTPFSPASLLFPQTSAVTFLQKNAGIERSWGYGSAYIPANYQTAFGIYSADGYDALHNSEYGYLLNSSDTGKVEYPVSRGDANIAPGTGFARLPDNQNRQKMLNLLGVKYILHIPFSGNVEKAETGVFPEDLYKLIWHDAHFQIYQNRTVFPRYFLATSYKLVTSQSQIQQFYTTDLQKTLLLTKAPNIAINSLSTGKISLLSYQPNKIVFTTQTSGNSLLFLSDTYEDGWKAKIDRKETPVQRADVAFRAVAVPKGHHTIVLYYQPIGFILGVWISVTTGILGVIFVISRKISTA